MLGGLISRQTYVFYLTPLYQMFPIIATRFFAIWPPCAISCAFCAGFSIFKMALKSYFRALSNPAKHWYIKKNPASIEDTGFSFWRRRRDLN